MECLQLILMFGFSDRACDEWKESKSKILDNLHDTETCSQKIGLNEHGDCRDYDSTEYGNTASQKCGWYPPNPFYSSHFSICL